MDAFRVRASTVTRIRIGDATTAAGLSRAYIEGAGEFLLAAKVLDKDFGDLTPEFVITFHATELALKAFLIKQGMTDIELRRRPYRHNLVKLHAEAVRRGLVLVDPDASKMIAWINEWHDNDVKIRYEFSAQRELPMCVTLFPLVEAIISACN